MFIFCKILAGFVGFSAKNLVQIEKGHFSIRTIMSARINNFCGTKVRQNRALF